MIIIIIIIIIIMYIYIYIYILFFLGGAGIYNNIASKEDRQKSKLNKLC